jgi:hypothetical protein
MPLHLAVPGLLWPKDSLREAVRDLRTPALATLIGRGRVDWQPALPFEHWLCRAIGITDAEPPCAALRLAGEGIEPGGHAWICADPAHLRFARGTLIVGSPGELDLSPEEAVQLVAALNEHLGHVGEFIAPHPGRWYLRLGRMPRIVTHPHSAVVGRPMETFLPQGEEAAAWRHIINEAQVLLHNHPLNVAREEAGRPTANSLWPWGAGVLPAAANAPARAMYADHPLARGLARLAGLPCHGVPREGVPKEGFVLLEDLAEAAQSLDLHAWRAAIEALEQRWFQPLLAALKSGQLKHLRLTGLGDEGIAAVSVEAGQLWKLWRRPKPLSSMLM